MRSLSIYSQCSKSRSRSSIYVRTNSSQDLYSCIRMQNHFQMNIINIKIMKQILAYILLIIAISISQSNTQTPTISTSVIPAVNIPESYSITKTQIFPQTKSSTSTSADFYVKKLQQQYPPTAASASVNEPSMVTEDTHGNQNQNKQENKDKLTESFLNDMNIDFQNKGEVNIPIKSKRQYTLVEIQERDEPTHPSKLTGISSDSEKTSIPSTTPITKTTAQLAMEPLSKQKQNPKPVQDNVEKQSQPTAVIESKNLQVEDFMADYKEVKRSIPEDLEGKEYRGFGKLDFLVYIMFGLSFLVILWLSESGKKDQTALSKPQQDESKRLDGF